MQKGLLVYFQSITDKVFCQEDWIVVGLTFSSRSLPQVTSCQSMWNSSKNSSIEMGLEYFSTKLKLISYKLEEVPFCLFIDFLLALWSLLEPWMQRRRSALLKPRNFCQKSCQSLLAILPRPSGNGYCKSLVLFKDVRMKDLLSLNFLRSLIYQLIKLQAKMVSKVGVSLLFW